MREGLAKREGPSALAHRLAGAAFQHSLDRSGQTPYSLGASEAFDMVYSGAHHWLTPHSLFLRVWYH